MTYHECKRDLARQDKEREIKNHELVKCICGITYKKWDLPEGIQWEKWAGQEATRELERLRTADAVEKVQHLCDGDKCRWKVENAALKARVEKLEGQVREGKSLARRAKTMLLEQNALIQTLGEALVEASWHIMYWPESMGPAKEAYRAHQENTPPAGVPKTKCSVCGEHQYNTPSGITCPNGHGGAPPAGEE